MRPNFLIVGAAKSGTTALDGYLKQHPDVFLPETKESRYFSKLVNKNKNPFTNKKHVELVESREAYFDMFKNIEKKALGDVSPDYLYYHQESIKNIKHELGKSVKIIIILRNPVQRTFSNYLHILREGHSELSFNEMLSKEDEWVSNNSWYGFYLTKPSFYYSAVKAYVENFDNVKIIIFEDFIKAPEKNMSGICKFLEIDSSVNFVKPAFTNKTGVAKSRLIEAFFKKNFPFKSLAKKILVKILGRPFLDRKIAQLQETNLVKPEMDIQIQKKLLKMYLNDIELLENYLSVDLSVWKSLK